MKISLLQMNMKFGDPDYNFKHAAELIQQAAKEGTDTVVLPETWNTGFFPKENLKELCDKDGARVKKEIGSLASSLKINIVAGSVANLRNDNVYNTAMVFDRQGTCIAEYDKTHLFTPMGEHEYFSFGDHLASFQLDGIPCGIIICYDLRFPELTRTLAVKGLDILFIVSQWPTPRVAHLNSLSQARAIENQMYVALTNSCGTAGETKFAGHSSLIDPWGTVLEHGGDSEQILTHTVDLGVIAEIRSSINVFRDRKPSLYHVSD